MKFRQLILEVNKTLKFYNNEFISGYFNSIKTNLIPKHKKAIFILLQYRMAGPVQPSVQIVVRLRLHNLTLFVRANR